MLKGSLTFINQVLFSSDVSQVWSFEKFQTLKNKNKSK